MKKDFKDITSLVEHLYNVVPPGKLSKKNKKSLKKFEKKEATKMDILNILDEIKKRFEVKVKKFYWTKKRLSFTWIYLNFLLVFEFNEEKLDAVYRVSDEYEDFFFIITNIDCIIYFGTYLINEIKNYSYFYILTHIYWFNKFYLNFFNFICLYNNDEENFSLLNSNLWKMDLNLTQNKYEEFGLKKKKQYYFDNEEKEINFEHMQFIHDSIEDSPIKLAAKSLFKNVFEEDKIISVYNFLDELPYKNNKELDEWEYVYGPKGFFNVKWVYSTTNWARLNKVNLNYDLYFNKILLKKDFYFYQFDEIVLRILEIFLKNYNFFYIDNLIFNKKWEQLKDLIVSKDILKLKIDLNCFLFLRENLTYYRNLIYDKYLLGHKKMGLMHKNRVMRISYFKNSNFIKITRILRLYLNFLHDLKNYNFIIFFLKKEWDIPYIYIYNYDLCEYIYNNIFFKHTFFLDLDFLDFLSIFFDQFYWVRLNYLFMKELAKGAFDYMIECYFIYHYENVLKYLKFYEIDEEKIIFIYQSYFQKLFLSVVLPNDKLIKNALVTDLFIFWKPLIFHYYYFNEISIFDKFLEFGFIKYFRNIFQKSTNFESLEKSLLVKWLKKFFIYIYIKNLKIEVELIDNFIFWITRIYDISFNFSSSIYDWIFFSRYISNFIFCKDFFLNVFYSIENQYNIDGTIVNLQGRYIDIDFLKLDVLLNMLIYKDFIMALIEFSLLLNVLFFFLIDLKLINNYEFIKYFFFRYYIWNDKNKIINFL